MLFNSMQFVIFFVVVSVLYYRLEWRWRWKMLLAASCVFYMAFIPAYIAILFTTILIDYALAIQIGRHTGKRRKLYLQLSIVSTCLVLAVFKYSVFFGMTVRQLQAVFHIDQSFPIVHLILPIGLSFHTFQSLSYVVEVYRGRQKVERNFGIYALYVMFYPQLVAGPIERPQNVLHQFYEDHRFDEANLRNGLLMIAWGLFQKMVIADRCAVYVNRVYGERYQSASGLMLLAATILFAVQIYADFSGYSSIAIGCARVMGIRLMTNFNHPYFAGSFADFWRRWHISLSTWFRDYVYIPLGGNRVSRGRNWLNLLATFTLSGFWHGANWTFLAWGALNGMFLIVESQAMSFLGRMWQVAVMRWIRRALVLACIVLAWVFFRAPDLHTAGEILWRIFTDIRVSEQSLASAVMMFTLDVSSVPMGVMTFLLAGGMFVFEWMQEYLPERWGFAALPERSQLVLSAMLFCLTFLFGVLRPAAFVYFQF